MTFWPSDRLDLMKTFFAIVAAGLALVAARGADQRLGTVAGRSGDQAKRKPDVLVVADAVGDIPEGFRPSKGKPVYYVLVGKVEMTLGNAVGGVKMPKPAMVEGAVVEALASQGFVRTQVGGPIPSICILVAWGDANFIDLDDPPPPPGSAEARVRATAVDRSKVETIMGTYKPSSASLSDEAKIAQASNDDRLYIFLAALDPTALRQKKKKLLWRTSMSIDGRETLAEALPAMLASAAPFFGLNSDKPVFIDDKDRRKADVEIGELKIIPGEAPPAKK